MRSVRSFLPWFPLSADRWEQAAHSTEWPRRHGATVYQVDLSWLLPHSPSILVIPGTSSIVHLEENIAASEIRLTEVDLAELDQVGG